MKRTTLITILFATLAVYGCSSDDEGGEAGSGGSAGSGGTGGSGGSAGTGGSAGAGGGGGTGGTIAGTEYIEDFDSLDQMSPTALSDDPSVLWGAGWKSFAEVFDATGTVVQSYPPAGGTPNGGDGFSAIVTGEGGAEQGANQLSIYSDYGNQAQQTAGNRVEANTYRERTITMDDVDKTITFSFDAKLGDIGGNSTANAFIKTLDPNDNFATTNNVPFDTTDISVDWMRYEISFEIDANANPTLEGQLLQFGFVAKATNNEPSGVFYDNVLVVVD